MHHGSYALSKTLFRSNVVTVLLSKRFTLKVWTDMPDLTMQKAQIRLNEQPEFSKDFTGCQSPWYVILISELSIKSVGLFVYVEQIQFL